jgi:hypothetical protein
MDMSISKENIILTLVIFSPEVKKILINNH